MISLARTFLRNVIYLQSDFVRYKRLVTASLLGWVRNANFKLHITMLRLPSAQLRIISNQCTRINDAYHCDWSYRRRTRLKEWRSSSPVMTLAFVVVFPKWKGYKVIRHRDDTYGRAWTLCRESD